MTSLALAPEFIDRLKLLPGYPLDPQLYLHKPPLSFWVNTRVTTDEAVLATLKTHGIEATSIATIPHAYTTTINDASRLTSLPLYESGAFYIQSSSSMIPAVVLDPQPEETILDMCAAPGSKTLQMANMMGNTGSILANDVSRTRMFKLLALATRYQVATIKSSNRDGRSLWRDYQECFDKTLLDVPCSMEGRMYDPKVRENWSTKEIKRLGKMSQWLLRSAISATRPGGHIVFSTCTIAPEENEAVLDWILKKDGEKVRLLPIEMECDGMMDGVTSWNGAHYHADIAKARRIVPSASREAFFIALLEKLPPQSSLATA